jgi:hypothetical protein
MDAPKLYDEPMSTAQYRYRRQFVYQACVEAAVELGASSAPRILATIAKSMLERAAGSLDYANRQQQAEAAQLLSRHKDAIAAAYPDALRRQFAASVEADSPSAGVLSFDSLELMAEDKVDETVELVRAQQAIQPEVEAELTELNALISAAQGNKVVRASANPLRPPAWVRALRDATLQCPVPAGVRLSWMQHLGVALGPELAAVYRQLSQMLRTQGVAAASFAVHTAGARPGAVAWQPASASAPTKAQVWDSGTQPLLNLRDLRRLLVGDKSRPRPSSSGTSPPAAAASELMDTGMTVPFSFQALQEMNQVDQAVQRMRQRRAMDEAAAAAGAEPSLAGLTPAQALSQEVVKLMIDTMAADQRLVPPVQQALRDLQPALLQLVRHDPRFFSDKQHPTRRLISETTQRALAWSSADAPGFAAFFEPLRQVVDALAALPIENADPFEFALQSLRQAWGEQEERSRRERAKAARVLIKAEKRNIVAAKIADDLMLRQDVVAASAEIRRFLIGPWAQVMAAAQLADGSGAADPGGYSAIINDLVWTTQPRLTVQNPNRLAQLIPPLLQTLRQGLASIEYPADQARRFTDYLEGVHQAALRPDTEFAVTELMPPVELEAGWDQGRNAPRVWLEQSEARDSGLLDLLPGGAPEASQTGPAASGQPDGTGHEAATALTATSLQTGDWAEVFIGGAWSRWQLAWASPQSLMFMFADGAGRHQSMTRAMLDKMIALGALRVLPHQTVLDGALDAVADAALRNSMASRP